MDALVTVVFDDERAAFRGARAILRLASYGKVGLFGLALIEKRPNGTVTTTSVQDPGPSGTLAGTPVGALIEALGDPTGSAADAAVGGAGRVSTGLTARGVSPAYRNDVDVALTPGRAAIVSEMAEATPDAVDREMRRLGGILFRESMLEFADREGAALRAATSASIGLIQAQAAHTLTSRHYAGSDEPGTTSRRRSRRPLPPG